MTIPSTLLFRPLRRVERADAPEALLNPFHRYWPSKLEPSGRNRGLLGKLPLADVCQLETRVRPPQEACRATPENLPPRLAAPAARRFEGHRRIVPAGGVL